MIEIFFVASNPAICGELISWDVYPHDLNVEKTLLNLGARYPGYKWDWRHTDCALTVSSGYFRRENV